MIVVDGIVDVYECFGCVLLNDLVMGVMCYVDVGYEFV